MRLLLMLGAAAWIAGTAGCASDHAGRDVGGDAADGAEVGDGADGAEVGDGADGPDGADGADGEAASGEVEGDSDDGEAGDGDAGDGADAIAPGTFGWACDGNEDCISGYCVDGYTGRVCSETCSDGCAAGWACRQDLNAFPDIVYVCLPSFPTLCRPCDANAECAVDGATNARCLTHGDDGAFCGGSCAGGACPEGYSCEAARDVAGNETPQCVPTSGICTCSPSAIAAGAATTCAREDAFGRCTGQRICRASGLTGCDAPEAALDVCNGKDDDCDGDTDDAFEPTFCVRETTDGRCQGMTVCDPTTGLPQCAAPDPAPERCDNDQDDDCDGETDEAGGLGCVAVYLDADSDGVGTGLPVCLCHPDGDFSATVGGDCDDSQGAVRPGATEICDGLDNDCDGATDDAGALGCNVFYADLDQDDYGDPTTSACLCAPDVDSGYTSRAPTDCDDGDTNRHPGASEVCNGVDDDCDTQVDEDGAALCTLYFADGDEDDWGDPTRFACQCVPSVDYPTAQGGDCNDDVADINPGHPELCDGVDNDCNGATDEPGASDCTSFYRDSDGDHFGVTADGRCLCAPEPPWQVTVGGDCNDASGAVNPEAREICNGVDDNCVGGIDEAGADGCSTYYRDNDHDSFGSSEGACVCHPSVPFTAQDQADCDDASPFTHPGAIEVCNGIDDNCDGGTDEGVLGSCSPFYKDVDGDGWGLANDSVCLCGPDGDYRAVRPGDCDDTRFDTHPFASESCGGGDEDCDGATDEEGAEGCDLRYRDPDHDGVGIASDARCLCGPSGGYTAPVGGDCDETKPAIHPGATEACNGVDDNCDGATDPASASGCVTYLRDADGDHFGVTGDGVCLCAASAPFTASVGGDCNDADPNANPGRLEICNGKDDDCSGAADDPGTTGCIPFYRDHDHDTWGDSANPQCLCGPQGELTATVGGDCDDQHASANPGVIEACNGLDDDCDAQTDEQNATGCELFLKDGDGDTYGQDGQYQCLCAAGPVYRATVGGDCDDVHGTAHPGAAELCDGLDNDCDRTVDEANATNCTNYLRDVDGDTYGVTGDSRCLCAPGATYRGTAGGDCNDGAALVSPAATEYCNGVDDDCDTTTDEDDAVGCVRRYVDQDQDEWGVGAGRCLCAPTGAYTATQATDCADGDPARNPGLPEKCGGIGGPKDEDCDGQTDEANAQGCGDVFLDADHDDYGVTGSKTCLCGPTGDYTADEGGDCNDGASTQNPAITETCNNGVDDDCDGLYDEGCGLLSAGWPTTKYDRRRSAYTTVFAGPNGSNGNPPAVRWKRQLGGVNTSAVFDGAGDMYVATGTKLYRMDPSGATLADRPGWPVTLPATVSAAASPTLREGGTIVVPTGNGLALYTDTGTRLWYTKFAGDATETITGAPLVDGDGASYVVGYLRAYKVDAGGNIVWSINVANNNYSPAHVSWSPQTDALHFGSSNHTAYAVQRDGTIKWTYSVLGRDVDASTVVGSDGVLYQSFGDYFRALKDDTTTATLMGSELNTGGDMDTPTTTWFDATTEHILATPNGNTGLRSYVRTLGNFTAAPTLEWTFATPVKDQSPNSIPAIDKNQVIYLGDNNNGAGRVFAVRGTGASKGTAKWTWSLSAQAAPHGTVVIAPIVVQTKAVIFEDDQGYFWCLADP